MYVCMYIYIYIYIYMRRTEVRACFEETEGRRERDRYSQFRRSNSIRPSRAKREALLAARGGMEEVRRSRDYLPSAREAAEQMDSTTLFRSTLDPLVLLLRPVRRALLATRCSPTRGKRLPQAVFHARPISVLRLWISEGLTHAES